VRKEPNFRYGRQPRVLVRRCDHLWQGWFHSRAFDERYLWPAVKYVDLNPVGARRCRRVRSLPAGRPRKENHQVGRGMKGEKQ